MKKLCVAPCGKIKIWSKDPKAGPTRAKDVYIGPFASTCRKYAEYFYPNTYMILSAKYGFLAPNDKIPRDYNVTFNDLSTNPITFDQLRKQVDKKGLRKYDCIIVLGGRRYVDLLEKAFIGKKIVNPLEGCSGNGEMMSVLLQAIQLNRPIAEA